MAPPPQPLRVAQIGTKHGHAAGKMASMLKNPDVEVAGVFEPDAAQRAKVMRTPSYVGVHWYDTAEELLADESIVMVAAESYNLDNLNDCSDIIAAGKHCWFDKPAGDDWEQYQATVALAQEKGLHIQMGYMLRYNSSWLQVVDWARSGFLGQIVKVRANMSTSIPDFQSYLNGWPGGIYPHKGGIGYDLASHCLDSVLWLMGDRRPERVTGFLRSTVEEDYDDNTVGIFEYEDGAMAIIDISARVVGLTRRLEVYGTKGTAIIAEPFEPGTVIKLILDEARGDYEAGEHTLEVPGVERSVTYELDLADFIELIRGEGARTTGPLRPMSHDLLVQETLLRFTGELCDEGDRTSTIRRCSAKM